MATQSFALGLTFMRRRSSPDRVLSPLLVQIWFFYRDAVVAYLAIFCAFFAYLCGHKIDMQQAALVATVVYGRVESFQGYAHFVFP
jgi:hypothetical protein